MLYTTFRKQTKSGVWSLSEFPCFIVYAARNIPSISDTMWCKARFIPGLYSVRRSTQTELRKRIYADTRVMAFILLRRSRRVCTRIVGVFILGICAIPGGKIGIGDRENAPQVRKMVCVLRYGVDLHSKYKPGFRDQESYHTILDISFDTRYLYIAQVSSD